MFKTSAINDQTLIFGKYKGKTLKEVGTEDPGWIRWFSNLPDLEPTLRSQVDRFLREHPEVNMIQHGRLCERSKKHCGKTVAQVLSEDPGYLSFLLKSPNVASSLDKEILTSSINF